MPLPLVRTDRARPPVSDREAFQDMAIAGDRPPAAVRTEVLCGWIGAAIARGRTPDGVFEGLRADDVEHVRVVVAELARRHPAIAGYVAASSVGSREALGVVAGVVAVVARRLAPGEPSTH